MASADTTRSRPISTRQITLVLAGLTSFSLYALTSAPAAYWLDSSELAAAGFSLGIPHPPGHPLYVLLAKGASFLPLGGIGFRINLLSALMGAIAVTGVVGIAWKALRITTPDMGDLSRAVYSTGAGLAFAGTSALWLQSTRAEVYTLQAALSVWSVLFFANSIQRQTPYRERIRGLYLGSVLMGLGLTNHHYLCVFLAPIALAAWLSVYFDGRKEGKANWSLAIFPLGLLPLVAYAYLPIRAMDAPLINWVDPSTFERFWDVLSARVFHTSVTSQAGADLGWNGMQGLFLLMEQTSPVTLPFALLGGTVLARQAPRLGGTLLVALAFNILSTSLMKFDRLNPDTWGYLQLSMGLYCLLATIGLAWLLRQFESHIGNERTWTGIATAILAFSIPLHMSQHTERSVLSSFQAPERFEDALLNEVPPSGLLLSSFFSNFFNHWYSQVIDGRRPDLVVVSQSFDSKIHKGVPYTKAMATRYPQWAPVFSAYLETLEFPLVTLAQQAQTRPILHEPEAPSPLTPFSRKRNHLFQVAGIKPTADPTLPGGPLPSPKEENWQPETNTVLLWHHYQTALMLLHQGETPLARQAVAKGARLNPSGTQWKRIIAECKWVEESTAEERPDVLKQVQEGWTVSSSSNSPALPLDGP